MRDGCGELLALATAPRHSPHYTWVECADTNTHSRAWHAPRPMQCPCDRRVLAGSSPCPCGACQRLLFAAIAVRCRCGIGNTTGRGCGFAMLALWFLLLVALAGPQREKPPSSSRINAGTAEPFRVSPPEAVAYPLESCTTRRAGSLMKAPRGGQRRGERV